MKFLLRFALLAAVVLAFVAPVHAAQPTTFKPTITEVGKDSITVKTGANPGYKITGIGENGLPTREQAANVKIYAVSQWTKITLNGKLAKITDLKGGMEVRVTVGVDRKIASEIAAKQPY